MRSTAHTFSIFLQGSLALLAACGPSARAAPSTTQAQATVELGQGFTLPLCEDFVGATGEAAMLAARRLSVAHGFREEEDDTSELRGALRRDVIQAVISEQMPDVRGCYEAELARSPELAGRLVAQFVIDPAGAICHVESPDLLPAFAPVFTCIANDMRTWQFPPPMGGGALIINYPFVFSSN